MLTAGRGVHVNASAGIGADADADADVDVDADAATYFLACSAQGGSPLLSNSAHWKKVQLYMY